MLTFVLRLAIILFIIYASLFGGVVEHVPLMQLFHQITITLIFAIWLAWSWRKKRPFPPTLLDIPLLVLGTGWLLSAITSENPRVSLIFTWPILVHILLFYLFVDLMQRGQRLQRWVFEGLFLTGALIVLISSVEMAAWYFGWSVLPQFSQSWPRLFGLSIPPVRHTAELALNHKNPLGAYCLLVIPAAWLGATTVRERDLKWGLRGLAFSLVLVVILTQSSGAYLGLVGLVGMTVLFWLLRPENRARFPSWLQPLLAPQILIAAALVGGIFVIGAVLWIVLGNPDYDQTSRIDMWFSAIEITRDHPLLGVGPRQYASTRLAYGHWERSYTYLGLQHAHNLPLNLLAEGGIIVLAAALWVAVRFARVWWCAWQQASPSNRRRIESAAIGLIAFAAHSMVDTFLQTQLMLPMLILAAYVTAQAQPHATSVTPTPVALHTRRVISPVLLGLLLVAQIMFVMPHRGAWQHRHTLAYLNDANYLAALKSVRATQDVDPWMDLYVLQEANILGFLAYEAPEEYLSAAIETHESALRLDPAWALGWHNLGALYAQAGRYDDAVHAAQQAISWDDYLGGYFLKLGEYHEALGNQDDARQAFYDALQRNPWLASSGFWTDPAHPTRVAILTDAVTTFAHVRPLIALDIAMYAGDLEAALALAAEMDFAPTYTAAWLRLDILRTGAEADICVPCYFLAVEQPNAHVREYLVMAEQMLHDETYAATQNISAEKAARAALFLSEGHTTWSWYILARLVEADHAPETDVDDLLLQGVPTPPAGYNDHFAVTVYGLAAELHVLPQARTPAQSRFAYTPWLDYAARLEAREAWNEAHDVYERLLERLPYAWDLREHAAALPDA